MDYLAAAYSAVVAAGGLIGYLKAGSVASLVAGLTFGGISAIGAFQVSKDPQNVYLLLGSSGVLAGLMGARFYNSHKFMPAGLVASFSLVIFLRYGYRFYTGTALTK